MLSLEQALERILAALPEPAPETIPLSQASGRVALEAVNAPLDLPLFDNCAMDGYALRAADTQAAGRASPVPLRLSGQVAAGQAFARQVRPGNRVRVFT